MNSHDGVTRAVRVMLWAAAAVVIVWAVRAPAFRDAEGAFTGAVCLPIASAIALAMIGWVRGTAFQASATWAALALVGQAVSLQMIDAGHRLHYQHYVPLDELWRTRPSLLAGLGIQTASVVIGVMSRSREIRRASGSVRGWQLVCAALLSASTAAAVSPSISRFIAELGLAAYVQVLNAATLALVAATWPPGGSRGFERRLDRLFSGPSVEVADRSVRPDRLAWRCALAVTVVTACLNVFVYQRHPHIRDEVAYLYQARYFARGMLTMPAPPVPQAFEVEQLTVESDRWFSTVPAGWPAALALGVEVGVPWLVNPVLGGVNILLTFVVLVQIYGRSTARLGTLLLALSPWHLFLAMSFMTHTLTLTCALVAVACLQHARRTGHAAAAFGSGAAVGVIALIRPLDAAIVGVIVGAWAIVGGRVARLRPLALAALLAGTAATGFLTLAYNAHLSGHALQFPINDYFDKVYGPHSNAYGFGPDRGVGWALDPNPGHSPLDAAINANLNASAIGTDLFGWSTGSLIFVALYLVSRSMDRRDAAMIAALAVVLVAYSLYYYAGGPDFGARYWFLMIVPLVTLTARGIEWLGRAAGVAPVRAAVVVLWSLTIANFVPWRAADKYYRYLTMRPDLLAMAKTHQFDGALVLIRGQQYPDFESAAFENPIELTSRAPIYAWDRSMEVRAAVVRAYADRPVWLVDGPTLTKASYRIVAGPLPASAVLDGAGGGAAARLRP